MDQPEHSGTESDRSGQTRLAGSGKRPLGQRQTQCGQDEKIEYDTGQQVDQHIDHVVTRRSIAMQEVVQCKTDIGHRPVFTGAVETRVHQAPGAQLRYPDITVFQDIGIIIQNKGCIQGVGVQQQYGENQKTD